MSRFNRITTAIPPTHATVAKGRATEGHRSRYGGRVPEARPRTPSTRESNEAGPSDATLVERALNGDRDASGQLFRRHASSLNRLALRLMRNREDAEDLVQDAFAEALYRLRRLRDPQAFGGWVRTMLARMAGKRFRRRKIAYRLGIEVPTLLSADQLLGVESEPELRVQLQRVYALLHELPAQAGVALILHRVEGMTISQVASTLGMSEGTVKRRIRRAVVELSTKETSQ